MLDSLEQTISAWAASLGPTGEMVFRILCAGIAGAVVGMERELRGRLAGLRTNMLVCLGSALVMVVSIAFADQAWPRFSGGELRIDPSRIAYGVMTGIGFLGAGTIMQSRGAIRGLTTAAALWCVAALGLALGFGLYLVSALGCLIIVIILWLMDYLEAVMPKKHYRRIILRRPWSPGCVRMTIEQVKQFGLTVEDATFHRTADPRNVDITLLIMYLRRKEYYDFEHRLSADQNIEFVASFE